MAEFLIQTYRGDLAIGSMVGLKTQGPDLNKGLLANLDRLPREEYYEGIHHG